MGSTGSGAVSFGHLLPLLDLNVWQGGVLDPQGPVGSAERTILLDAFAIMLGIIIPTSIATIAFAWWFRADNPRARYRPDFVFSGRIELIVWSIPTLTIIFLGGMTWIGSHELDPATPLAGKAAPIPIQVVSLDWKWLFIYPRQGIATVNQLTVPAGTSVSFELTSASVMNAFFVPQLGSMIYTMNGMTTRLNLRADRPGDYYGRSTMFSGDGFPGMEFTLHAVKPADFDAWVQTAKQNHETLDAARYGTLVRQSMNEKGTTFGAVQADLFQKIVSQSISPGPGPQEGRPDKNVKERGGS